MPWSNQWPTKNTNYLLGWNHSPQVWEDSGSTSFYITHLWKQSIIVGPSHSRLLDFISFLIWEGSRTQQVVFFFPTTHGQVSVKIKLGKYFWSLTIRPFSFEKGELFHRATSLFLLILSVWVFSPGLTPLLLELFNLEKVLILFSARIHKQKKKKEFISTWYTVKNFPTLEQWLKKKKVYTFPASQLELPVMYCGSQLCFCLTHPICQEGLTTVDIHLEGVMRGRQGQRSISESLMSISHQSTGVWSLKESVAEFKWRILKPELTPYFSAANSFTYLKWKHSCCESHSVMSNSFWPHGLHVHGLLQARILE